MKNTTYIILGVLAAAVIGYFLYSDCKGTSYDTDVTIALDRTGSYVFSTPDKESIKKVFQVNSDLWKGYRFRLLTLSDVDLNKVYEVKIEPECEYLNNLYERRKRMEKFSAEFNSSVEKLISEPSGRPSSSLFVPFAGELMRLSKSDARKKIMIVFSDLMEESYAFSFNNQKNLSLLKQNPDSVMAILNKEASLPQSLSDMEIYIIYQPVNSVESEWFHIVSEFYKKILEQRGAIVTIGANLIL